MFSIVMKDWPIAKHAFYDNSNFVKLKEVDELQIYMLIGKSANA